MPVLSRIADPETAALASQFMRLGAELMSALTLTQPEEKTQSIDRMLAGDYALGIECSCNQHGRVGLCLTAISPPSADKSSRRVVLSSVQVPELGLPTPPKQ